MNLVYSTSGNDILHALVTVTNIRKPSTSSSAFITHIGLNKTNLKQLIDPNKYIDDEVIDAFMGLLDKRQMDSNSLQDENIFFSTLWLQAIFAFKYNTNTPQMTNFNFDAIAHWHTYRGDIFDMNELFFLINIGNQHWSLVVVHMENNIIQYYDSNNWNISIRNLPHQGCTFHCAAYMCLFAERIAANRNCTNTSPTLLNERARWYIMSCISHDKVL